MEKYWLNSLNEIRETVVNFAIAEVTEKKSIVVVSIVYIQNRILKMRI